MGWITKKLGLDGKRCLISAIAYRLGGLLFCFLSCRFLSVTSSLASFLFSFLITTGYGLSSLAGWLAARGFLAGFPCTISVLYWCTRQGLLDEDRGRGERWKRCDALAVFESTWAGLRIDRRYPYYASPPSEPLDCIVFYFNERLFSYTAQGKATNKLGYEKKYK